MRVDLFVAERIWPCHAGGYWFSVEGIVFNAGIPRTVGSALGTTATKWGARRKLRRYKQKFAQTAQPS